MFLIHKVASRRSLRDNIAGQSIDAADATTTPPTPTTPTIMHCKKEEYDYCYDPMDYYPQKSKDKRKSRSKSGFFGGKSTPVENKNGAEEQQQRAVSRSGSIDKVDGLKSKGRKLRKAASKSSFAPVLEEETSDKPPKSPMLRHVPHSWKARTRSSTSVSAVSSAREGRISQPFNFFHISHAGQRDISQLQTRSPVDLAHDWVRVSTQQPPKTATTITPSSPLTTSGSPQSSFLNISRSPESFEFESSPSASQESFGNYGTTSPSPRSSSREDSLNESSEEFFICHAITTPGESACGEMSPGIERVMRDSSGTSTSPPVIPESEERSATPEAPIPELRETQATPDLFDPDMAPCPQRISLRLRPTSQFAELNPEFILPGSPLLGPQSARMSKRISAQRFRPCSLDLFDQSWEEDIDYSYDHAAESYCDYDWDKGSVYACSTYADSSDRTEDDFLQSPQSHRSTDPGNEYLAVPQSKEKRITGQFEAHLLLPGSSGSDTVSKGDAVDYESSIILRAAQNSLRHRSLESIRSVRSSASIHKLTTSQSHRDELARVAEHLDNHIAYLNAESQLNSPRDSLRPTSQVVGLGISTGRRHYGRARTDSNATCVTLCSDAETITPTESAEVITPPNSNHNSFSLAHSHYTEMRLAKGLSFPASTIPGVVEFSPEMQDLPLAEGELVSYI